MDQPLYQGTTRWLVTITVILAAVVEVLDMTIVNVSLPNMMGALGANSEQITWILTSYIVSAAICMPLTGFFVNRYGQKKILLISISGFLITSMLCGLASNLIAIVIFRILQGIFGAALVPLSQIILRASFNQEEQGKAMAIWGIGIMCAPIMGPTIGGFITEELNWRWVFYINVPVCIICFFLTTNLIKESKTRRDRIDWLGIFLMATGIGCLQIFLDRGNQSDWFDSYFIGGLFIAWITAIGWFAIRGWGNANNIINLRLFKNRNFSYGCILITIFTIGVFGIISLQPIMLESYMGYSTEFTGWLMAPRGLASALGMFMVSRMINRYDPRHIIACGIIFSAAGTWLMSKYAIITSFSFIITASMVQGFGIGLFFVPLSVVSFSTMASNDAAEASGIFNFARNLGSSIGISIISTLLTREAQINWHTLVSHINHYNINLQLWLEHQGWKVTDPLALQQLTNELQRQAGIIAFIDCFRAIAIGFLLILPTIYLMQKPQQSSSLDHIPH